jgi:kinesin family protein 3/17
VPEDESLTVKVVVRVRPLIDRERGMKEVLDVTLPCSIRLPNKEGGFHSFAFDSVLPSSATQGETYAQVGAQVLEKALAGFNATIFAYGQTGSGQTFAMEGSAGTAWDSGLGAAGAGGAGIIPRLAEALFKAASLGRRSGGSTLESVAVSAEYVEIYNERVVDLLAEGGALQQQQEEEERLTIRQRANGEIYLDGAQCRGCPTLASLQALLAEGAGRRTRGETHMNAASSRSHAVLTLHLDVVWSGLPRTSKLHLIDLAGSERADATGARGERLREGAQINKSLSALGGVIGALTTPGRPHIPYRDSKLTRLLQDSLGGNAVTVMLCCVSPADANGDETLSSLRFAERAKKVRNVAKVNVDPTSARLAVLEAALKAASERAWVQEVALGRRLGFAWPSSAPHQAGSGSGSGGGGEGRAALAEELRRTLADIAAAKGGVLLPTAGLQESGAGRLPPGGSPARVAPEGVGGRGGGAAGGPKKCLPCCMQ